MEKQELIDLGVAFRGGKFPNETWESFNGKHGNPFSTGEAFRCFVKRELKKQNKLVTKEQVKTKEIESKLTEVDIQLANLKKEKIKLQDQRTEYNKILREQARYEDLQEVITNTIRESNLPEYKFEKNVNIKHTDNDLLINLTDLHYGLSFDEGFFGKYNTDIFKERLEKYFSKIVEISNRHNCEKCYVFLGGDIISGFLHNVIRVANSENVIQQIQNVSEILSNFLYKLSDYFNHIYLHTVHGNHSRIFQDKKESLKDEKLDLLIPWYIKARLSNIKNITVVEKNIDSTIAVWDIRGKLFYGVHGDFDIVSRVVDKLTLVTGVKPYGISMAHLHHNALDNIQGVKVISSGSFVGVDSYCIEKRIVGKPAQMVCVCSENGIECFYDVELN